MRVEAWASYRICQLCNKECRSPLSTFRLLNKYLPIPPTDISPANVLCIPCRLIAERCKTDIPPPDMVDRQHPGKFVETVRVFCIEIECADTSCGSRIQIIAPTTRHWNETTLLEDSRSWSVAPSVVCAGEHSPKKPATVLSIKQLRIIWAFFNAAHYSVLGWLACC